MADPDSQEVIAGFITTFYKNILKSSRVKENPLQYLEARLVSLEKYWADYYKNHLKIAVNPKFDGSSYIKNENFYSVEEDFTATKAAILREIEKLDSNRSSASSGTNPSHSPVQGNIAPDNSFKHLPSLSLPQFSGNQLEWETYRDLFTAMVHNSNLPDVQKLYYLESSLTGKAAERLKNMPISDANYKEAWSMLVKRFDNKRILLASHMRKLLSCPAASKRSVEELLRLSDAMNESIRAFENMGRPTDTWDDWFVHILVHKLDPSTREDWETSLQDAVDFPTFKQLSKFIDCRIRALEAARPIEHSQHPKSSNSTPNQNLSCKSSNKGKKQSFSVNVAQSEQKPKRNPCPICKSLQFISYCPQFKKLKPSQRLEQINSLSLCSYCLREEHISDNCPSTKNCFVSAGRHHTFLHDVLQQEGQSVSNSVTLDPTSSRSKNAELSKQINHLSALSSGQCSKGIFATAYLKLSSFNDRSIIVKGFLDSGSERSLVTERVTQLFKLHKTKCEATLKGIGNSSLGSSSYKVDLWLRSPKDPDFQLPLQALVLKNLIQLVPKERPNHEKWPHLQNLDLADPNYSLPETIDCIIGIDLLGHTLLPGLKQGPIKSPTALLTTFGWILFGPSDLSSNDSMHADSTATFHVDEKDSLDDQLRQFLEIEEIPPKTFLSENDTQCEKFFKDIHHRDSTGRYIVRLSLLGSPDQLGRSRDAVVSMFLKNEKRLLKDPVAKAKYNDFMSEYFSLGHMKVATAINHTKSKVNYLPHHVISKAHDPTSKIRVVFNGSFRSDSGVSLNDILHPGQKLQSDIWSVITKWRFWKYAFTADIVKMFRQIHIQSPDYDLQRIVWRPDPSQDLQDYCLSTVTYGTRSAPFLAIRVLNQLALDEKNRFPLGSQVLEDNIYVDDIFAGAESLELATKIRTELITILASAGITLSKWAANNVELIPESSNQPTKTDKLLQIEDSVSTLGMKWNPKSDHFHFSVEPIDLSKITKRTIASEIAKLFDPLGWLSPFLVKSKILLQDCWLSNSDWDAELPNNLTLDWNSFVHQLHDLELIQIPRWISTDPSRMGSIN